MLRIILFVLAVFCIKIETTIKYHIYPVQNIAHCGSRSVTPAIVTPVPALKISLPNTNLRTVPQKCLCYQGWKYKD